VVLQPYYPGLGFFGGAFFFFAGVAFALLLFSGADVGTMIVHGTVATCLAVAGGTLRVTKMVLEVGFHLQERLQLLQKPEATHPSGGGL
jgi:hypothetical protein